MQIEGIQRSVELHKYTVICCLKLCKSYGSKIQGKQGDKSTVKERGGKIVCGILLPFYLAVP